MPVLLHYYFFSDDKEAIDDVEMPPAVEIAAEPPGGFLLTNLVLIYMYCMFAKLNFSFAFPL